MAEAINIQFERSRRYGAADKLRLEIDSEEQTDRITIWSKSRGKLGYGHGPYGQGRYGYGKSLGYGNGAYGRGVYGQGADIATHTTQTEFVAGDYSVRARVEDEAGNVGSYSSAITIQHRPTPPFPTNLQITTGTSTLTWSWSDP